MKIKPLINKCLYAFLITVMAAACCAPVQASAKTFRFGDWRVKVTHDRFADLDDCRIYGKDMTFRDGVVSLNFQHDIDTDGAWYRIDGGAAGQVSSLHPQVVALSVFPERGPLENPSNGHAKFPADLLIHASIVDIRAPHTGWVKHFRTEGLEKALVFVNERNCPPPTT